MGIIKIQSPEKNINSYLFIEKWCRQVVTECMSRKPVVLWKSWIALRSAISLGEYFIYLQEIVMFTGKTSAWPWPRNS